MVWYPLTTQLPNTELDPDWGNAVNEAIQDTSTGHDHDGTDSKTVSHTSLSDVTAEEHHAAATTVTEIAASGVVGTSTDFARKDHVHKGVHRIIAGTNITVDAEYGDVTINSTGGGAVWEGDY